MVNMISDYPVIEQKIKTWAVNTSDVKSVFAIGSRAHDSGFALGSDLDVIVVTSRLDKYRLGNIGWSKNLGPVVLGQFQPTSHMLFEHSCDYSIIFEKELDVDFSFISEKDLRREIFFASCFIAFPKLFPQSLEMLIRKRASAFYSGFRSIHDGQMFEKYISGTFSRISWEFYVPLPNEFMSHIDDFLVYSFKAAKKIQSGKYFQARWMLETTLKYQFITLAEWHNRSQNNLNNNARLRDLSIDKWADVRVKTELARISSTYDRGSICASLAQLLDLFYWVSAETAKNFGYSDILLPGVDHFEYVKRFIDALTVGE